MGFNIKSFETIRQDMIDKLASLSSEVTDFNLGSNIRNIIATVAAEIEETYYQLQMAYLNALPATATSTNLDTVLGGWGVVRSGAAKSFGMIRFNRDTAASEYIVIPADTMVATQATPYLDQIKFVTEDPIVLDIGSTIASGYATAVLAGKNGNVDSGMINTIISTLPEMDSCINELSFTGGMDAEDDLAYRTRFIDFVYGQGRGTPSSIEGGALTIPEIVSAKLIENIPSAGQCELYVATSGGAPSVGLIQQVQTTVDSNYRPAGVTVTVYGAVNLLVNISCTIIKDTGVNAYDLRTACENELYSFLATKKMGEDVLLAEIARTLMNVNGVINIKTLQINSSHVDLEVDPSEIAKAGTFTLTVS